MNYRESIKISLAAIMSNKIRTLLTMSGIIIGVMSIILLISIVAGTQEKIQGEIESMGSNVLMVLPGNQEEMRGPPGQFTVNKFRIRHAQKIQERSSFNARTTPVYVLMGAVVKYKNDTRTKTLIAGTGWEFPDIRNWHVAEGNYFRNDDERLARKVCVVGKTIVRDLFKGLNPIGKEISVNGVKLRVIGVTEEKGMNFSNDQDDLVAMPITTMHEIAGTQTVNQILVKVPDPKDTEKAAEDIKRIMLSEMEKEDFTVKSQSELLGMFNTFANILSAVMGAVAGISLFVGGIGIMNIMLVTVKERTREIGLRKAVGAKFKDVLLQFIVEALVIAFVGALAGIFIAVLIISAAGPFIPFPLKVSATAVTIAFFFAMIIGIFFGTYPAVKAARTDPIIALRYE